MGERGHARRPPEIRGIRLDCVVARRGDTAGTLFLQRGDDAGLRCEEFHDRRHLLRRRHVEEPFVRVPLIQFDAQPVLELRHLRRRRCRGVPRTALRQRQRGARGALGERRRLKRHRWRTGGGGCRIGRGVKRRLQRHPAHLPGIYGRFGLSSVCERDRGLQWRRCLPSGNIRIREGRPPSSCLCWRIVRAACAALCHGAGSVTRTAARRWQGTFSSSTTQHTKTKEGLQKAGWLRHAESLRMVGFTLASLGV